MSDCDTYIGKGTLFGQVHEQQMLAGMNACRESRCKFFRITLRERAPRCSIPDEPGDFTPPDPMAVCDMEVKEWWRVGLTGGRYLDHIEAVPANEGSARAIKDWMLRNWQAIFDEYDVRDFYKIAAEFMDPIMGGG